MVGPSPLVSVHELGRMLGRVTLLDVRWKLGGPPGHEEFARGHVSGAAYVDLETDLADPPGSGGRHPLPDPPRFAEKMRRCGVSDGRPVVVYDAVAGGSAARCWWLLRYHGHSNVRVLDGGYQAWLDDGRQVQTQEVTHAPGDFTARPGHMCVLSAQQAGRLAREGTLIDARTPERFRGETEPVDPVAGHIPGAVNVPISANLTHADGSPARFRSSRVLASVYARAGVPLGARPGEEVGVYCGSGVTAAHDVLALDLLGVEAALYPGSWSEWVTDPGRPVATGSTSGRP